MGEEGAWGGGGGTESFSYSLRKRAYQCISLPHSPPAESDFGPAMLSRELRGYQKSDPGGDSYCVGCLGQTPVSQPE